MAVDVQQITGTDRSVSDLLANNRYGLDFYQREYSWGERQVRELIDDLAGRFLDEFEPNHERRQVLSYRPYFLGPIVTAQRDGVRYLVDGQQRVTTLSLLLIHLRKCLAETHLDDATALDSLISSFSLGQRTFNLDVDEREKCLFAILEGRDFDTQAEPASVRNLWEQYHTIVERFPENLQGDTLPFFADWLQRRVILVDIRTRERDMALEIFETMNDRGLRLSNTDMLKSYLLARVGDEEQIRVLNDRWRRRVTELTDAENDADADFVKAWLRGNYATTQRERKANAAPGDFDDIGTAFHKWVRENAARIGLRREAQYRDLVERDFFSLSSRYLELLRASQELRPEFKAVYYNARAGFTLQLPVILAAITPDDDDATFTEKTALVSGALDIYVVRRMVNFRNFGYSTVVYSMFNLMKDVRNRPTEEVRDALRVWLDNEGETLTKVREYSLHQRNRKHIHYLLARITAWLDDQLGTPATFANYVNRSRKHPFEIEHILANNFERHQGEFDDSSDFENRRNAFGALLLLPKDFNASYGDMPYDRKVEHYRPQNPLASSLHPKTYENNPSFLRLRENYGLSLKPHPTTFSKADIDERTKLYQELVEIIWDPARIGLG